MQQNNRIYGLDALRAIAMLLGIVLHSSIAYKVYPNPSWPSDNQFHSWFFDGLYLFIHAFRMQIFYLVAGFFACLLYKKIGENAFVKHRIKRIVIPFIGSLIFVLPITIAPFLYYKYFIADQLSLQEAQSQFFRQLFRWNGMAHLWFLYYLVIYYGVMLVILRIKPLQRFTIRLNPSSFIQVLGIGITLAVIQILCCQDAIVEVSAGIIPRASNLIYYGFFFMVGYHVQQNQEQFLQLSKQTWLYLLSGGILTAVLLYFLVTKNQDGLLPSTMPIKSLVAFQTIFLVFGAIGFFLRYLNTEKPSLKYIADASYWLYLVHLSMVASLQIAFCYTGIPGALRFWLILLITNVVALATYEWFIRYTFIGTILHGPRTKTSTPKAVEA